MSTPQERPGFPSDEVKHRKYLDLISQVQGESFVYFSRQNRAVDLDGSFDVQLLGLILAALKTMPTD